MNEFVTPRSVETRFSNSTSETETKRSLFTRLERGTQALLDSPGNTTKIIGDLRSDLQSAYGFKSTSYGLDKFPHLVSKEALVHLGADRFIEQSLPLLRGGISPVPNEMTNDPDLSAEIIFREVLSGLWMGNVNSVKDEIKSNPDHPYRPVWEHARDSYQPFRQGISKYEPARILDDEFESHLNEALRENAMAAYKVMHAIKRDTGQDATAVELTERALANLDTIGWIASIDGNTLAVLFGHAPSRELPPRVNNFIGDETLFAYEDARLKIVHPALKGALETKPKEPSGTCTGRYLLATPGSPNGEFDTVSLILTAGAHLAQHTVFL